MDRREKNRRRMGPVKAGINSYGERIHGGNSTLEKPQMHFTENPSPRTRELHLARRDIGRLDERKKVADSVKSIAESELFDAKKTLKDLTWRIEESSSRAKAQIRDREKLKKPKKTDKEQAPDLETIEDYRYAKVMRELEYVKQELAKLKLDMAYVLEEKRQAEKEIEASSTKLQSYTSSVKELTKEIEELNEEQVVVELARIEALKELQLIEAHRQDEVKQYSFSMEEIRKKMNDTIQEIDHSKELETKLAVTTSDVNMIRSEFKELEEMEKKVKRIDSLKHQEYSFQMGRVLDSPSSLRFVTEELEAAKKELASIKEESFRFMASMDVIREELKHVSEETDRIKKTEEKADLTVQKLNSKLLRAKAKLEAASEAGEKAKSIISNLSLTIEQLKTEAGAAKKEKIILSEKAENIKAEVQKTKSEIDSTEERLQTATLELEAVKASEEMALENLKTVVHKTIRNRASASKQSSTITISIFEYEYLTGQAIDAEKIADKKVAAAQAWVESLQASEKELLMQTEIAQREIRELKLEEEQELHRTEQALSAKKVVENELSNWGQKHEDSSEPENVKENLQLDVTLPTKSMNKSRNAAPARRTKLRKSASPATRQLPRSTSHTIRRRRKVMPSITKFFSNKSIERNR